MLITLFSAWIQFLFKPLLIITGPKVILDLSDNI
ncbi:MAG: hypothetical protein ACI9JR_001511 [Gammaproteobacteria bacterium]|jgi:hypothetical protein